jgi:hypothetical protein
MPGSSPSTPTSCSSGLACNERDDKVFTNQFIDQINAYDRAAVITDVKKEDISKLR